MTERQLEDAYHRLAKEALAAGRELERLQAYEAKRLEMMRWFERNVKF